MSNSSASFVRSHAHQIVVRRKTTTSIRNDTLIWFPGKPPTRSLANRKPLQAPAGSVVWGALGFVAGIGALAIPGSFITGGITTPVLMGVAVGTIAGGLTGLIKLVRHKSQSCVS